MAEWLRPGWAADALSMTQSVNDTCSARPRQPQCTRQVAKSKRRSLTAERRSASDHFL